MIGAFEASKLVSSFPKPLCDKGNIFTHATEGLRPPQVVATLATVIHSELFNVWTEYHGQSPHL